MSYILFFLILTLIKAQINLKSEDESPIQLKFINQNNDQVKFYSLQDNSFVMTYDNNSRIMEYISEDQIIISDFDLNTEQHLVLQNNDSYISFNGQRQWKLFAIEDFQSDKKGWSLQYTSTCGTNDNVFLGGHCNFGEDEVEKQFVELPQHEQIMIKFNFHFIDDWNGETAFAKIDSNIFWTESYNWCEKIMPWHCKKYGIDVCGKETPDRMSHPVQFVTKHDQSDIVLSFGTNSQQSACDLSWGIDDIQIYLI